MRSKENMKHKEEFDKLDSLLKVPAIYKISWSKHRHAIMQSIQHWMPSLCVTAAVSSVNHLLSWLKFVEYNLFSPLVGHSLS